MSEILNFEIDHDQFEDPMDIKVEVDVVPDDIRAYFEMVRGATEEARLRAARAFLGEDGDGLPSVETIVAQTQVVGFQVLGETERYAVQGTYSDGGGNWSDWVDAVNDADAEFAAKWAMAENQGAQPKRFDNFLKTMERIQITRCEVDVVTKDEYRDTLKALAEEVVASGHSGPALDEALGRLRSDGHEVEMPSGPTP